MQPTSWIFCLISTDCFLSSVIPSPLSHSPICRYANRWTQDIRGLKWRGLTERAGREGQIHWVVSQKSGSDGQIQTVSVPMSEGVWSNSGKGGGGCLTLAWLNQHLVGITQGWNLGGGEKGRGKGLENLLVRHLEWIFRPFFVQRSSANRVSRAGLWQSASKSPSLWLNNDFGLSCLEFCGT